MFSPVTNTLIRIFAKGFFREHAGMLVFFLVTIGSSFFFMETVGDVNLLPPGELLYYHFILVITFISSPLMTLVIFLTWLVYTIKSWKYITSELRIPNHQFLFYSITASDKAAQFTNWFCMQLVIFIPLIVYWLFACVVGIIFQQYLLPAITLAYILILTIASAAIYLRFINRLHDGNEASYLLRWSNKLSKPYFSLFLYHVLDKMKLAFILTKSVSLVIIVGLLNSFSDANSDLRVGAVILLSVITTHSFLIYHDHLFKETQLSFSRNLPYSRFRLFSHIMYVYLVMLIPEIIWMVIFFAPVTAMELLIFGLSIVLLFRSLLYWIGESIFNYVTWIFGLYILMFFTILFNLWWILIPLNLFTAYAVFFLNYYHPKHI